MSQSKNFKENQAVETIAATGSWIETNKKKLIGGLVAVLVIVGGILGYVYAYQMPREEKAQTLITDGLHFIQMGDTASLEKAINGEGTFIGYAKIAKEYSGTHGANLANYLAGTAYAKIGKYSDAIPFLEAFTPNDDQSVSPMGLFALAQCYAATNALDKAVDTFKEAAELANNEALSPMCLLEAGKILENQNKKEEALKIYETIKNDYPTSALSGGMPAEIDKYIERAKK